jgi:Ni/Co efflux regulator RcnB
MQRIILRMAQMLALAMATLLMTGPALADKPPWAGGGRGDKQEREDRPDDRGGQRYFNDQHRVAVRDYYDERIRAGHCPPGLRKKHNGCMPPGQAKKWRIGQRLPREVAYHEVPPAVVVQLGVPPPGQRFVRVASDILLIAAGTGIVLDAIEDLGR